MRKWYWRIVAAVVGIGAVAALVLVLLPKPTVPTKIRQQLSSTLILPTGKQFAVDNATVKYDSSLRVLSFTAHAFDSTLVVSEQPSPEQFTDVPAAYQKVTEQMNDYYDFATSLGTVHLTTPTQLGGKQAAVINADGTLTFIKPSSNLSTTQWRQFFTSFQVSN